MICLLMLGCRSRKKAVQISEIQRTETTSADTNVVVSEEKKLHDLDKKTEKIDQKEKSNNGDIVIKGKTDSLNKDFRFHNVVNGDTISDIYISGNADFIIKNRWKQIDKKEIKETVTEKLNIIASIARKSVAQKTIKKVAEKIKAKEVSVKSSGFQFPVYLIIGFAVLLLILLGFLWKKFGGGIMDRFKNFKK